MSRTILVLTRGIEPRSPVYETGVLAVELDEHIWWTDQDLNLEQPSYELGALTN
jgi:hypothetical protein